MSQTMNSAEWNRINGDHNRSTDWKDEFVIGSNGSWKEHIGSSADSSAEKWDMARKKSASKQAQRNERYQNAVTIGNQKPANNEGDWFDNRHSLDQTDYDINKVEYIKRKIMKSRKLAGGASYD